MLYFGVVFSKCSWMWLAFFMIHERKFHGYFRFAAAFFFIRFFCPVHALLMNWRHECNNYWHKSEHVRLQLQSISSFGATFFFRSISSVSRWCDDMTKQTRKKHTLGPTETKKIVNLMLETIALQTYTISINICRNLDNIKKKTIFYHFLIYAFFCLLLHMMCCL